ncbi:MAG: hypothetical protein RL689_2534, partial [Planctomycetota bacterium]
MSDRTSTSRRSPLPTRVVLYAIMAIVGLAYAVPLVFMIGVAARPAGQASAPSLSPLPE